ncbi:MAG TPA: hypothetical protein VKA15_04670, partial [Isosphaeraceae bacterium]|nr:hypothetical protein [Isosphaeraceae bacterium]
TSFVKHRAECLLGDVVKPALGPVHLTFDPGPLSPTPGQLRTAALRAEAQPSTDQDAEQRQDHD